VVPGDLGYPQEDQSLKRKERKKYFGYETYPHMMREYIQEVTGYG
jgi:hypothetical protein